MLTQEKKSLVLAQGVFDKTFFNCLKESGVTEAWVLEGRPTLEAAESSCRELQKRKITPTLISDNMAGLLFYKGLVKEVWLAYQAADTDGALCDTGAIILGVMGKRHQVPVYLYPAGRKTKFLGKQKDLTHFQGRRVAPAGIKGYVLLAEWLPQKYITKVYGKYDR